MNELIQKLRKTGFNISTDPSKLQIEIIHRFLTQSYWAKGIPLEIVRKAIQNSFGFGVYFYEKQIGFARVITDFTIFAHLADVFILEDYRGKGLSKWLLFEIMNHPELQGLRKWTLATEDAHSLYKQFGFTSVNNIITHMEKLSTPGYLVG